MRTFRDILETQAWSFVAKMHYKKKNVIKMRKVQALKYIEEYSEKKKSEGELHLLRVFLALR